MTRANLLQNFTIVVESVASSPDILGMYFTWLPYSKQEHNC